MVPHPGGRHMKVGMPAYNSNLLERFVDLLYTCKTRLSHTGYMIMILRFAALDQYPESAKK